MKVLLTGGAGCLGSNITEFLAPISERVVIIDNFATGKLASIPDAGVVEVVEGSVTDSPLVEDIFSSLKPDLVIHGAASYKDPNDWYTDANTNVVGSILIARACERVGCFSTGQPANSSLLRNTQGHSDTCRSPDGANYELWHHQDGW